ncbi:Lysophospholipase [Frankia canadensis]|uniref:Lysophospholipase n=1 Tax=Frankia canadensis TaxID=1836972 RepID=A0A2I2KS46_9ACTN|nr:alpha/beta hydrolase [Frankia canadensis]SNQ48485.1 Lysophospholipase [Frankia canadensis]SOU55775.1 Lysophospholipase [Frankia canadensis]
MSETDGGAGTGRTIVFIHGLWLTSASWQPWIDRFAARGHRGIAPEWPGMDRPLDELRAAPRAESRVGITEVTDSYAAVIASLPEAPILIGHSFGGLIVQMLLDRGVGEAGIALSPAPVRGVLRLPPATLRTSSPVLSKPATRHQLVGLTKAQWFYSFGNTLTRAESDELHARLHAPTPGRPLWQAAFANLNPKAVSRVDFGKVDRAPLLIIGADADHTVPASVSREAYQRQRRSGAITAYHESPGRPHLTAVVPGWEAVADFALDWALAPRSGEI